MRAISFVGLHVAAGLCLVLQPALAEPGWDVNGYLYDPLLEDFSGMSKIRVVLVSDGSPQIEAGDSIAEVGGYFYIEGKAPAIRTIHTQKLKIYHRSDFGECEVTTYDGEGPDGEVLSGNYSVSSIHTVQVGNDSMCSNDLYPLM
ncbi:unnamed protein product [Bursaphelenchus xylophilus]|uniref:(pine wood nematode) hypothetical protein n=1 Tax=Bursaphelenchus xylophilus TaxID=6326 RepID=A0A1I7RUP8_BURXY|nr:unnamed protein product [Bursaphelenchus xylophilus]CAG9114302.1 unnamed protein product [Bursaphelenchus xylophilus]